MDPAGAAPSRSSANVLSWPPPDKTVGPEGASEEDISNVRERGHFNCGATEASTSQLTSAPHRRTMIQIDRSKFVNVTLTRDLERFVDETVRSGRYPSKDIAIQE